MGEEATKQLRYIFSNCLGAPVFRDKIGIFVPVEAKIFDA